MEALREIVRTHAKEYHLTLPEWAIGQDVEVIVLPLGTPKADVGKVKAERRGPLAVLGYARTFRPTKTTDEWMREFREGEDW